MKQSKTLRRWELALLLGVACAALLGVWLDGAQAALSDQVIRLHVLANSDSEADQALKLRVRDRVLERATELLEHFHQPILVEEYIEGKEVCASIAGTPEHIDVLEADLLILNGKDYQSQDIYSCEPKKGEQGKVEMVRGTHLLTEQMKGRFARLFRALGKVDVMRVDGRIGPDGFKLIELSPDCYMGADGSTALCFEWAGYSYPQMLDLLLQNALAEFEKRRSL